MGTFISLYPISSMTYYIKNNKEFNMNTIQRIRKYNKLALIIDRTEEEQKELERLEALIPNHSNCMIMLLRDYQDQIERDVEHDRALIERGSSIEFILQELTATLKVNLKTLKEIEREYNKTS